MKILLATSILSRVNGGGPSHLLYHLLNAMTRQVTVDVIYYSNSRGEGMGDAFSDMSEKVICVSQARVPKLRWIASRRLAMCRYPIPGGIDSDDYDGLWLYPESLYYDWKRFSDRIVVTGMDCSALLYYNLLTNESVSIFKRIVLFLKSVIFENTIRENHVFHTIGEDDKRFFTKINSACRVHFSRYPLYLGSGELFKRQREGHLVLGFSGGLSKFYHGDNYDKFFKCLYSSDKISNSVISMVFVGKDWAGFAENARSLGFGVEYSPWVTDYELGFLQKIDCQIVLLSAGAGVKTKVVNALGRGLSVIGTAFAFDSIPDVDFGYRVSRINDSVNLIQQLISMSMSDWDRRSRKSSTLIREHFDYNSATASFCSQVIRYFREKNI